MMMALFWAHVLALWSSAHAHTLCPQHNTTTARPTPRGMRLLAVCEPAGSNGFASKTGACLLAHLYGRQNRETRLPLLQTPTGISGGLRRCCCHCNNCILSINIARAEAAWSSSRGQQTTMPPPSNSTHSTPMRPHRLAHQHGRFRLSTPTSTHSFRPPLSSPPQGQEFASHHVPFFFLLLDPASPHHNSLLWRLRLRPPLHRLATAPRGGFPQRRDKGGGREGQVHVDWHFCRICGVCVCVCECGGG